MVFGNLLDNAIKYTSIGGAVDVTLEEQPDSSFTICITENGAGMSADEVRQLGQVFFRADTARSQSTSFGLGFAHCQRIIERLGGHLSIQSTPLAGTRVTIAIMRHKPVLSRPGDH